MSLLFLKLNKQDTNIKQSTMSLLEALKECIGNGLTVQFTPEECGSIVVIAVNEEEIHLPVELCNEQQLATGLQLLTKQILNF